MPSIENFIVKSSSKKFQKKPYRPWTVIEENQLDTDKIPNGNQLDTDKIPNGNQLDTDKIPNGNQLDTDKISISNQLDIDKIPNGNQLDTDKIPNGNQLDTDKIPNGNQLDTDKIPNGNQLDADKIPNGNQLDTDKIPNGNQLDTDKIPNGNQLDTDKIPNGNQLDTDKIPNGNQLDTDKIPNGNQLDTDKSLKKALALGAEKTNFEFKRLSGLQKKIVIFVGNNCIENDALITSPIPMEVLKTVLQTDHNTIKTALYRLVQKGLLVREKSKRGIGGFSSFKINSFLRQLLVIEHKNNCKNSDQLDTSLSTSSSTSSNILTTTSERDCSFLENIDDEKKWKEIDISSLSFIGFEKSHIKQLEKLKNLSIEIVEDSINAFAFDLEFNRKAEKIKGNPLSYFMGILRKGIPYIAPENYESLETRTLRLYLEQKEKQKQQKIKLEKKAFDLDLEEWTETLSEEKIKEIIPEPNYRSKDNPFRKGALSLYFQKNVWKKD